MDDSPEGYFMEAVFEDYGEYYSMELSVKQAEE